MFDVALKSRPADAHSDWDWIWACNTAAESLKLAATASILVDVARFDMFEDR